MMAACNLRLTNNPFTAAITPPLGEAEEECVKRVREEEAAGRISRETDEGLLEAKKFIERRRKAKKDPLLGKPVPLTPHLPQIHRLERPSRARPSGVSAVQPPLLVITWATGITIQILSVITT